MEKTSQTERPQAAQPSLAPTLRRVYWETTAACNLRCIHCRRTDVLNRVAPDQLDTAQALALVDDLAGMGKPVLILSGGEPLFRRDIYEIAAHASRRGLPVALSTNGTLVTEETSRKIRETGVYYASISLDGAKEKTHDAFRGPGSFGRATTGMARLKQVGIKVQINFTVTKQNVAELPDMYDLALALGAHALYLFLLVPVGCGVQIADEQMLSPREIEDWLEWVYAKSKSSAMELRPICAPQYYRIAEQIEARNGTPGKNPPRRLGCLAGINICFVSHKGDVYPCGYLPLSSGNVKQQKISSIWSGSREFAQVRDESLLSGKCGACGFKTSCGGCRARAYYKEGSILAEEPYCLYEPGSPG